MLIKTQSRILAITVYARTLSESFGLSAEGELSSVMWSRTEAGLSAQKQEVIRVKGKRWMGAETLRIN